MPKATRTGASYALPAQALRPESRPEQLPRGVRYTSQGKAVNPHDIVKRSESHTDKIESEDPSTDTKIEIRSL